MTQRIKKVLTDNGLRPDLLKSTYEGILAYYSQAHRYYHTIDHIDQMLERQEAAGWNSPELAFNILFHDIFYQMPVAAPGHNEQVSQMMAQTVYTNCTGQLSLFIVATANFMQTQVDLSENCQRLLDLDLCSMARPSYTAFVKQQDLLIKEGGGGSKSTCGHFLREWMKARPEGFFYTALARKEWWPIAQENINRYIKEYAAPEAVVVPKKNKAKKPRHPRLVKKKSRK